MQYREFLSLTDDEIRFIVNDIFNTEKIENIVRNEDEQTITCDITTDGWEDGDSSYSMTDELALSMPTLTDCGISVDFSVNAEEKHKWRQFCVAKGCNPYLNSNPYLDNQKKDTGITAAELIELLKEYKEFEIQVISSSCCPKCNSFDYRSGNVIGIADIGHSSKTILLDIN